ncbi:MAG TPA: hypothetical protein VFD72_05790 [Sphingobacteriaceae bacterium]|nr:hypothetical protein [Sphingobacteriaceae bacterium]
MDDRLFSMYEKLLEKTGSRLREEIAQELFGIRISLQRFILTRGHEENLTPLKGMIDQVIRQVTEVANELHPSVLAQIGFVQAVDDLIYHSFPRSTKIRCQVDRKIQSTTHCFQLNCYRILQDIFSLLKLYQTSGTMTLKIMVKENDIHISLDGFLNLEAMEGLAVKGAPLELRQDQRQDQSLDQRQDQGLDRVLEQVLDSRIALYSGALDIAFKKKRSLLMVKIYFKDYDNNHVGGRSSHRKKRH